MPMGGASWIYRCGRDGTRRGIANRGASVASEKRIGEGHGRFEIREEVDRLNATELSYYFGDLVFLEKADGGDAGGSRLETGSRIFKSNAAESQDRNFVLARLAKCFETHRWAGWRSCFFEDWRKEN